MSPHLPIAAHSSIGITHILIISLASIDLQGELDRIEAALRQQGYQVERVTDRSIAAAPQPSTTQMPDLVILDGRSSPQLSFDYCRNLRLSMPHIPIILLADGKTNDTLAGFEAGADDCLTQPFEIPELLVRIRVRLRHAQKEKLPILQFEQLILHCQEHQAYWGDQAIPLTAKEFELLKYLMLNPRKVVSRTDLIKQLWGKNDEISSSVIDTYICRLRYKLKKYSKTPLIHTVYGTGYTLQNASQHTAESSSSG